MTYYDTGEKECEYYLQDQVRHGIWTCYYKNGVKWLQGQYENGNRQGQAIEWTESGILFRHLDYKDDKLEMVITYHENGLRHDQVHYKSGVITGKWYSWYDNGQLQVESDSWIGETTMWYKNGKIKKKGPMLNGVEDGKWYFYDENGNLVREVLFKNGVEVQ